MENNGRFALGISLLFTIPAVEPTTALALFVIGTMLAFKDYVTG
jgi:hypothetical protein